MMTKLEKICYMHESIPSFINPIHEPVKLLNPFNGNTSLFMMRLYEFAAVRGPSTGVEYRGTVVLLRGLGRPAAEPELYNFCCKNVCFIVRTLRETTTTLVNVIHCI